MSGIPVVVVERFGLPVKAVEGRAPVMTVSPYGMGIPIVLSEWGAPFVVEGLTPPVLPGSINDLSVLSTTTSTIALAFTDAARATSHEYQLNGGGWVALDPSKVIDSLPPDTSFDVQVRGVNAEGNGPSSNTVQAQTQPVPIPVPVNTAVPTITGIAQVGEELTATTGTWTNSPIGYAYQWQRNAGSWADIPGATSSTYLLVEDDEGATIRVQVIASNAGGPSVPANSAATGVIEPASEADYVATDSDEWSDIMALANADLAGKILEIQGDDFPEELVISGKDIPAPGLLIRSADSSAKVPRIRLGGVCSNITFAVNLQMTGWPADYGSCFHWGGGTYSNITFKESTFRHGYGVGLTPINMTADLPEYERVPNVRTATTSESVTELAWQDPLCTNAWIEFFNRGTETVFPNFGGPGVTTAIDGGYAAWVGAGNGVAGVPPGAKRRATGLDPTQITHLALITASGSTEINARTEIGLAYYLAQAFTFDGAASIDSLDIRNCEFRDLSNAIKGGRAESVIIDRNDFDRIYMDLIGTNIRNAYITRNIMGDPFARSGIPENLNGDARDPHGDRIQSQAHSSVDFAFENIVLAGNLPRRSGRRVGVQSQGTFLSDNDNTPSYDRVWNICEAHTGGATNSICSGEANYPIGRFAVWGATILNVQDIGGSTAAVRLRGDAGQVYIGNTISQRYLLNDVQLPPESLDGCVLLSATSEPESVFPNLLDLATALTREEVATALTSAEEGAGRGAIATQDVIDWSTDDPSQVVRWDLLPAMVMFPAQLDVEPEEVLELPLRRVQNPLENQTISVGPGVEWRSFEADGETPVQVWTSDSGQVEYDQFVQLRITAQSQDNTTENFIFTTNGHEHAIPVKTKFAGGDPAEWLVTGGYFADPAMIGSGVSRIEFSGKFRFPTLPSGAFKPFASTGIVCDLEITNTGTLVRTTVKDSTSTNVLTGASFSGAAVLPAPAWNDIRFIVDHESATATLILNGQEYTRVFTGESDGFFPTTRYLSMLATGVGGNPVPSGTEVADLGVEINGSPHKTIGNNIESANSDTWKRGADFTQGS